MLTKQDFYSTTGRVITLIAGIQKGMTAEEVKQEMADFLDISLDKLKRYEAGEEQISLYEFFCLCEAYNFPFFATKSVVGNCEEKLLDLYSNFLPKRDEIQKRQRG